MPLSAPKKTLRWAKADLDHLRRISQQLISDAVNRGLESINNPDDDQLLDFYIKFDLSNLDEIEKLFNSCGINLKHVFDQAVCAIALVIDPKFKGDLHFPWSTNSNDLRGKIKRSASFLPHEVVDIILAVKPYKSSGQEVGNDSLRRFAKEINPQKHRSPISIKTPANLSNLEIPFIEGEQVDMVIELPLAEHPIVDGRQYLFSVAGFGDRVVGLKAHQQLVFLSGPLAGQHVTNTLQTAMDAAEALIAGLEAWLKGRP